MLTVAQALELESFKEALVVGGHGGLSRPVSWVHVVGVPDAARWLNGGELVLTTALNIPPEDDPEGQQHYLHKLIDKGVVGLVITTGQMLDHIPPHLCQIADAHNFPLIEIPFTARFVDIARAANEHITQANMALFRQALRIQQTLTQLVLQGGGFKELASTLATLIHQSVSIENDRFERLASVNIAPVDEARRYTQQFGRTDPRLVRALEGSILPEIRRTLRPVFIPQMAHVGLEMERILAPIVVHGEIYGYVWIIADDRPVSELDHMAIESGATIAALMLLHQQSLQSAEASLRGSLLTRLLQGDLNGGDVLHDQVLRYGVDLGRPFRVLVVDAAKAASNTNAQYLNQLARRINRLSSEQAAIAGQIVGQLVLLVNEGDAIDTLTEQIHTEAVGLRIGVSAAHRGAEQVALAHSQCREVLEIAHKLHMDTATVRFEQLGYLHALYHAGPNALQGNPHVPALRALLDENQADLFHTLETYLDAGGNGVSTAESLHIHRSTLNYRLQRITEICHADLSDPATRMNLQVALKLLRLFG